MSDQTLERAIMQALADNPLVHADEISVEARESGDVVLRGTVGSLLQRTEAALTTRRLAGVRDVDDRLRVRLMGVDGRADADTEAAGSGPSRASCCRCATTTLPISTPRCSASASTPSASWRRCALGSGVTFSPALFVDGERYEGELDLAAVSAALEAASSQR